MDLNHMDQMKPLTIVRSVGSMGSKFMHLAVDSRDVPLLARLNWHTLAPRVSINPVSGLISLVRPSWSHINLLVSAGMVVPWLGRALDIPERELPRLRLRRMTDPAHTGAEPAAAWYLDKTVGDWERAGRQDGGSLSDFESQTPPDLIIEVERRPDDGDGPGAFRRIGARELWWLDMAGEQLDVVMLHLQAPDGPQEIVMSNVLPPISMVFLSEALDLAGPERYDQLFGLIDSLRPDSVSDEGAPAPSWSA